MSLLLWLAFFLILLSPFLQLLSCKSGWKLQWWSRWHAFANRRAIIVMMVVMIGANDCQARWSWSWSYNIMMIITIDDSKKWRWLSQRYVWSSRRMMTVLLYNMNLRSINDDPHCGYCSWWWILQKLVGSTILMRMTSDEDWWPWCL